MARDKTDKTDKSPPATLATSATRAKGFNLATFDVLAHAQTGNPEPLARHLESGGFICAETRHFLSKHLRGEIEKPSGNRRTWGQIKREMRIVGIVRLLTRLHGSEYKAIREYCDLDPEVNMETLRGYLRKANKRRPRNRVRKP